EDRDVSAGKKQTGRSPRTDVDRLLVGDARPSCRGLAILRLVLTSLLKRFRCLGLLFTRELRDTSLSEFGYGLLLFSLLGPLSGQPCFGSPLRSLLSAPLRPFLACSSPRTLLLPFDASFLFAFDASFLLTLCTSLLLTFNASFLLPFDATFLLTLEP